MAGNDHRYEHVVEVTPDANGNIPRDAFYKENPYTGLIDYTKAYRWVPDSVEIKVTQPTLRELGDASIEWGKSSNFEIVDNTETKSEPSTTGFTTTDSTGSTGGETDRNGPDDKNNGDGENQQQQVYDFHEVGRATKEQRVENPDDSSQYVIIEIVTGLLFKGPDNNYWRYYMKDYTE